jgi:hypothetical protein
VVARAVAGGKGEACPQGQSMPVSQLKARTDAIGKLACKPEIERLR